jgi:hypothetical protein
MDTQTNTCTCRHTHLHELKSLLSPLRKENRVKYVIMMITAHLKMKIKPTAETVCETYLGQWTIIS